MLEVKAVSCHFGGLVALDNVSLKVGENELVGLMGPNGAGKTTLFNVINSFVSPTRGKIYLKGEEITSLAPHIITRKGLVKTFQDIRVFGWLDVLENVEVAVPETTNIGFWRGMLPNRKARVITEFVKLRAGECLDLVGLSGLQDRNAHSLTFGQQRLLGVARALACEPKILLLDEPSSGLNQEETEVLAGVIREIHRKNIAIFVIEHHIGMLMNLAQRIIVLDRGKKIMEGTPDEVREEERVIEAYFGEKKKWLT
jgi:branched-chain amino acid transport system ATP-binding protein